MSRNLNALLLAPPQGPRSTLGTYIDSNGILRTAQPGVLRPDCAYDPDRKIWVPQGWLREAQVSANTQLLNWWTGSSGTSISNINVTTESVILPDGKTGSAHKFTVADYTKGATIPYSTPLYREGVNALPVWSLFIKIPDPRNIDPGVMFNLGVSGQSGASWSPRDSNWEASILQKMIGTPAYSWNLYIPRKVLANGWVRFPIGGRAGTGTNVTTVGSFSVPANTFTAETAFPIYMWGSSAIQLESRNNYCSSFIYGTDKSTPVTRASD